MLPALLVLRSSISPKFPLTVCYSSIWACCFSHSFHIQALSFDFCLSIIAALIDEYNIETAEDIQEALKDLLGGTLKSMMEAEMDEHLGYESYERSNNPNYRNGTKTKTVRGNFGEIELAVPQDRDSTFEPKIVKKRQKDISDIDQKIISMYARGLTTRQISEQIEELYGFECSEGFISDVTDKILQDITDWQNRPLDDIYPILFIDAVHFSVRED